MTLSGQVVDMPQTVGDKTQLKLGAIKLQQVQLSGQILLTVYKQKPVGYGDRLFFRCQLQAPERIEDFNYDRYLAKSGIVAMCRPGEVLAMEKFHTDWQSASWTSLKKTILEFKNGWREIFIINLPADEGNLLAGIMLGDGYLMSQELKDAYSRSGLSHIVAISGMNMTMIAVFLLWLLVLGGLWRQQAISAAIVIIWLYTLAIGLPSSAVRASLMSTLVLIAYAFGRLAQAERLLVLAASLMLLVNPRILRDDVGFQLSFLAFLSLVWYYEPVRDYLGKYITNKYLQLPLEVICLTLATQVLTWPILAYNFEQVSLVAPLANLFVIWALGPLMIMALIGSLGTFILPALWSLAPVYFLASWLNVVAVYFGNWPYGVAIFNSNNLYLFILYYCGIMFIIWRRKILKNAENSKS